MPYTRKIKNVWHLMRRRCTSSADKDYKRYGARGIFVCDEWESFEAFLDWALSNGYEYGLSIDRINNDGPYSPDNCRWASSEAQANNRRSNYVIEFDGCSKTAAEWAKEKRVPYDMLWRRLRVYKWSIEKALNTPCGKQRFIEYDGKRLRLYQWADLLGFNYDVLDRRLALNWSIERAFTQPVR